MNSPDNPVNRKPTVESIDNLNLEADDVRHSDKRFTDALSLEQLLKSLADQDNLIAELQEELAAKSVELDAIRAREQIEKAKEITIDEERAKLMNPYANKVFRYLVGYSLCVFILLLGSGITWRANSSVEWRGLFLTFDISVVDRVALIDLDTPLLMVVAGSTAVAAIGLVGFVVSGLFGAIKSVNR